MESQQSNHREWGYFLLMAGIFIIASRSEVTFRFLVFPLLTGIIFYFVLSFIWHLQRQRAYQMSTEGIIHQRMEECELQISQNRGEIAEIEETIVELEQRLRVNKELPLRLRDETEQLTESFRSQLKLRLSKVAFFEMCKTKLEQLMQQHELAQTLEVKRKRLKRLQENNYEDFTAIEALRTNVEMDTLYLDTIENLSRKLHYSNHYADVERLRTELDEMTRSLSRN